MADIERGIFSGSRVRPKGNGAPASAISYGNSNVKSILDWQLGSYKYDDAVSGAVTIDPSLAARIAVSVDGDIASVTIALSATYPWVVVTFTTTGAYTMTLTGWETANGAGITLPDTGKCIVLFALHPDNTTKYAVKSVPDMS